VRLEGLGQLKNPMISWRIEPAKLQLVAQCLNQLRYSVPPKKDNEETEKKERNNKKEQ
jgi:hypothetical protein